jgi:hypothetical protein
MLKKASSVVLDHPLHEAWQWVPVKASTYRSPVALQRATGPRYAWFFTRRVPAWRVLLSGLFEHPGWYDSTTSEIADRSFEQAQLEFFNNLLDCAAVA